jgi:uncharacterized repeat protein (TIGR01451 family)
MDSAFFAGGSKPAKAGDCHRFIKMMPRRLGLLAILAGVWMGIPQVAQTAVEIFPLSGEWRFEQTTNLDGVAWTLPSYDDSNWPTGKALLYVENSALVSPRNTLLTLGRTTYYFRTHFNLPFPVTNAIASISHRTDDGAVFYLNGREVQRVRMPTAPALITYSNLATGTPLGGDATSPEFWTLSGTALTNLVPGDNVLAVEVHQNLASSDDIVFGCSVTWTFTNAAPIIVTQPRDVAVLDGRQALLFAGVDGQPAPTVQWFKEGNPIAGATNGALLFANTSPTNAATYWLVASNSLGSVTTSNVLLTVLADDVPPAILAVRASKNLTNLTVTFSEPVRVSGATNPANYTLFQTAFPTNQLIVNSVATAGSAAVTLRTAPRTPGLHYTLRVNGVQDTASVSNQIAADTEVFPNYEVELVAANAAIQWRYSAVGALPAANWFEAGYDDSLWPVGAALFHGGSPAPGTLDPVRTSLSLSNNGVPIQTYYFRTAFDLPGVMVPTSLRLHDVADDGAVFYLNGQEAYAIGLSSSRPTTYAQAANRTVGTANYEPSLAMVGVTVPDTNLLTGQNLVAAEVHQSGSGFGDVAFGLLLEADISQYHPQLRWTLPAGTLEGAGTLTNAASLSILEPRGTNLVIQLTSSRPADLVVPAEVTIPAEATNISFNLLVSDNAVVEGPRNVQLRAAHFGLAGVTATLPVFDNETNTLDLIVASDVMEVAGSLPVELRLGQPAVAPLQVALASSDLSELLPPASITIPAGMTSVVFQVTVVNDNLLDGPQQATLSATVAGWPAGLASVTVNDDEPRTINVSLPAQVLEWAGTLVSTGRVQLAGVAISNLTVQLSSSMPGVLGVVSNVIINAGQSNAFFDLVVKNNDVHESSPVVVITATILDFNSGAGSVLVLDDDAHHFTFAHIPSPQYTNTAFPVTITAHMADGSRQMNFYFTGLAASGQNGAAMILPSNIGPFVNGVWTGMVQVLSADRFVRLQPLAAPGLSEPFHVEPPSWRSLDLLAEDLVYDATRHRIYASVSSGGSSYSNSVVAIDPVTASILWFLPVGEIIRPETSVMYRSGKMALSDDGQFLYVAVSNAVAVRRVNLNGQTLGPVFAVGANVVGSPYSVADIVVLRGTPNSVAVARANGFNSKGVAIFDNGIRRPDVTSEFGNPAVIALEPAADTNTLYGTSGFGFSRLSVSTSGVSVQDSTQGWLSGFDGNIAFDGGLIFGSFGAVIEPLTPRLAGNFAIESASACCIYVAPDVAMGRAYFLSQVVSQVGLKLHLQAHDLDTFLPLKALDLPSDGGGGRWLIRCGNNGLAFISTAGKVYFVRSSLLTELGMPADLVVTQSLTEPPLVNSNYTVLITISNRGPETASETVVTDTWPTNHTFVSASISAGFWSTNGGRLNWMAGMLPSGSNATAMLTLRAAQGGWSTNRALVMGNEPDSVLADNHSVSGYFVQIEARPNSLSQLVFPANDLAFDPHSQKLFVTVPGRAGSQGNSVQLLDPMNGAVTNSFFVGNEPGRFALSEDNQYLYVAGNTNRTISQIHLPTQGITRQFGLGSNAFNTPVFVEDMAVLPGQPEAVAVSRQTKAGTSSGFTHEAVAIYDQGVVRPNVGHAPSHYYNDVIEFGADASMVFAHNSGAVGFNRLSVNSQGVTFLDSDSSLLGDFTTQELEFAEGLLYTTSGWVINPYTSTLFGRINGIANSTAILFDAPTRRLFFIQPNGVNYQLLAFEVGSFLPLGSVNLPGVQGTPLNLTRWGIDGLAFRTTGDQLFILRTDLAAATSPADLQLTLAATSPTAQVGSDYTYSLTLRNLGPATASGIWLTNGLPPGSSLVAVVQTQGSWTNIAGRVVSNIGPLSSNTTASISIVIKPVTNGLLRFSAVATAATLDLTNSNNRVNWLAWSVATNTTSQTMASLGFNDIAADPVSGRIYASLASTNAVFANSLMWINPATGQIGQPVPLGANPNRLAISRAGHYLYAGLDDANAVQQFDLVNQTAGIQFALGSNQRALAIDVNPTNATQVAVYRTYDGVIARYDNGVKAPVELSGMTLFTYADDTSEIYACDGAHTGVPMYRVHSTASGLSLAESQPGHQYATELKADGGLLFYNPGMVVEPKTKRVLAIMPVPFNSLLEPDVALERVFYLTPAGSAWTLRAFDLKQGIEVGAMPVSGLVGTPKRLIRWGTDGLAICTSAGQLVTLQGGLVPTAPVTDVALRQSASVSSITTNEFVTYTLTLTNHGPALAQSLVVTQAFSLNMTGVTALPSTGTAEWSNNRMTWQLSSLSTGAVATLTLTARPSQNGTLSAFAAVRHSANDPTWANNAALAVVNAQLPENSNILQIRHSTRELVYDSARDMIYASVPASNHFLGNTISLISPATGNLLDSYFVGSEPNLIAPVGDGTSLYVSLDGNLGVKRLSLPTGVVNADFPLSLTDLNYAQDLEVSPINPEVVIASLGSLNRSAGYPSDVLAYVAGQPLPNVGGPARGLCVAEDGVHLFGYRAPGTGIGFVRMKLDSTGITLSEVVGSDSYDGELKFSQGRLYNYSGQMIDPFVPAVLGQFAGTGPQAVDAASGQAFYLTPVGTNWQLRAFDIGTLQNIGTQVVANVQGTPGSLIRCGANRLAFRTSSNQLFIVRSSLLSTNLLPAANLAVSQQAEQDFNTLTETVRYTITVTNPGPTTASNVTLAIAPPAAVQSATLYLAQGTSTNTGANYLCRLGALPGGQAWQVELRTVITNTGYFTNFVSVSAQTSDPDFTDNRDATVLLGRYFLRRDSVRIYPAANRCLAYDPVRRQLYAALTPNGVTNEIAWFNPESGELLGRLTTAIAPTQMRVTDDGQYLYLTATGTGLVQRIHLPTRQVDLSFTPSNATTIAAMAVIPGNPKAVALTYWNTGLLGTAIFDDGVSRPDRVEGLQCSLLESAADATALYGFAATGTGGNSPDVFRMTLSGAGLQLLDAGPSDIPGSGNGGMRYLSNRVYFANGVVLNPSGWIQESSFVLPHWGISLDTIPPAGLVAFLNQDFYNQLRAQLTLFRIDGREQLAQFNIPAGSTSFDSLTYCDSDRLAFRTPSAIVFVRSGVILAPDLVTLSAVSTNLVVSGDSVQVQVLISNTGPSAISGVSLTNMLPSGTVLTAATISAGTIMTNGPQLVANIGSLAANAAATLVLTFATDQQPLGWRTNAAVAMGVDLLDPIPANNATTVKFAVIPRDTDADGLSDDWELAFGLSPTNALDAFWDSDCDGDSNLQEYRAGSNPLRFEAIRLTAPRLITQGKLGMQVHAALGKVYDLETSSDLIAWSVLNRFVIQAMDQSVVVTTDPTRPRAFYRLRTDTNAAQPLLEVANPELLRQQSPILRITALPGQSYTLQVSSNMVDWVGITNFMSTSCLTLVADPFASGASQRFYRVASP